MVQGSPSSHSLALLQGPLPFESARASPDEDDVEPEDDDVELDEDDVEDVPASPARTPASPSLFEV